jgi:hypothetical protein
MNKPAPSAWVQILIALAIVSVLSLALGPWASMQCRDEPWSCSK